MALKKRTYSQRDKKLAGLEQQEALSQHDKNEVVEPSSPRKRPKNAHSLLKKGLKSYVRPAPISRDELGVSIKQPSNKQFSGVFDKVLNNKHKPVNPKKRTIYGDRQAFDETMMNRGRAAETPKRHKNSYLPTPPYERQVTGLNSSSPSREEGATKVSKMVPTPAQSTETSPSFEKTLKNEALKQSYIPKQYKADVTAAPHRDIVGNRLSKKSKEAQLWSKNQTDSPFLRLPDEVRSRIYKYAFCGSTPDKGNTIKIAFQTYNTNWKGTKAIGVTPMFKYHCSVFNRYSNPWVVNRAVDTKYSYTLLNGVCRQLYEETAALPYEMNHIAFDSHNIMVNFLMMEKRISSRQRAAIKHLVLKDELPGENMLAYLPNLSKVYLATEQKDKRQSRGWYDVERPAGARPKLVFSGTIGMH